MFHPFEERAASYTPFYTLFAEPFGKKSSHDLQVGSRGRNLHYRRTGQGDIGRNRRNQHPVVCRLGPAA